MGLANEITCSFSNSGTRQDVRMRVVNKLALEQPGTDVEYGTSRYIYYVEQLDSGNRVYLQRPANLHNGFDFLVCVENTNYAPEGQRRRNYPKHNDFATDLQQKKQENPQMYAQLYNLLLKVYNCHDVTDDEFVGIEFETGYPTDHIVKVMKWLFIEQDIRYWNYSGRSMTWSILPKP